MAAILAGGGSAAAAGRASVSSGDTSWRADATAAGAVPAATSIDVTVVLNLADPTGAEAFASAVSDPSSPTYGQYLSAAAFTSRYAASTADVASVQDWLTGSGLTVTGVAASHIWVHARGSETAIQKAFGTSLRAYTLSGRAMHAPAGQVTVPAPLAKIVAGVTGLSSTVRKNRPNHLTNAAGTSTLATTGTTATASRPRDGHPGPGGLNLGVAPPPDVFINATPCSAYWGEKKFTDGPAPGAGYQGPPLLAPCGYTGAQIRSAYGVGSSSLNGAGATVAVVDAYAAPTIVSDLATYNSAHGVAQFAPGQFRQYTPRNYTLGYQDTVNGDQCGENGWYQEETLDITAVHSIAPAANVVYVAASDCLDDGLLPALDSINTRHLADIVTNSWGDFGEPDPTADAATLEAYRHVFVQAAAEGIGMYFSSGDDGDVAPIVGFPTASFPASSPWVTAVGGTTLGIGRNGQRAVETGWETDVSLLSGHTWDPQPPGDYLYGSGGGLSQIYPEPAYQQGVVPAATAGKRNVPDVAAVGDPSTGMLVGESQTFPDGSVHYSEFRIGGTSLSSPLIAGFQAIADQVAGHAHGFANPALYRLRSSAFTDMLPTGRPYLGIVRYDYVNGHDAADGVTVQLRTTDQANTGLQTLYSTPGYDNTTGRGVPNGTAYVQQLSR
ncbi:MAG: S53 family peptidase [Thermoleophilia bacterium]